MDSETTGKVYLVGGGPGALELLTHQAEQLLQDADAIVYDAMAPDEPVLAAPGEKYYVGKRSGVHALPQNEIEDLLVRLAREGKTVVRFKGGDPFIFGRGGEEAFRLANEGIEYEVVPGVSSGTGVPGCAGLPLTCRKVSQGVTFLTGHAAADGKLDFPWEHLANLNHTLVFFMSVSNLPNIVKGLLSGGMEPSTPVAAIQEGSLPTQRMVHGTLDTIAEVVKTENIRPPSLIVVGKAVNITRELKGWHSGPLAGKKIILARAVERIYPVAPPLRAQGARVYDVPVVQCIGRDDPEIDACLESVQDYDLIIFSSVIAGRIFSEKLAGLGRSKLFRLPPVAAASPAVARSLIHEGWQPQIVPERVGGGKVVDAIRAAGLPEGAKILLPRTTAADMELPGRLEKAGYQPTSLKIYDTVAIPVDPAVTKLIERGVDAVLFTSGTGVRSLAAAFPELITDGRAKLVPMGRKTARIIEEVGGVSAIVPAQPTIDHLIASTLEVLTR